MKIRKLTRAEVETEPFQVWNSYVDLLAAESYEELSVEQRPAHLVFWYENEVQNGGHLQYFENRATKYLTETIAALGVLGAACQQQVLLDARHAYLSRQRPPIETAQEFCDVALEGEFNGFDSRFHACSPSLQECLEGYLTRHQQAFVEIE